MQLPGKQEHFPRTHVSLVRNAPFVTWQRNAHARFRYIEDDKEDILYIEDI